MTKKVRGIIGLQAFLFIGTIRVVADYKEVQGHAENPDGNDTTRVTMTRCAKHCYPPVILTGMALDI